MNRLIQLLASFGATRLIGMGAVGAALIGFFLFISLRLSEPEMTLLFSNLDMAESGQIVEQLKAQNIPYRVADSGRTILAPADQVNELRVSLAGQGLGGDIMGYEIFDRSDGLGTTSFVQNINLVRAIEGELSRTIREIRSVDSARVHIVMPERALFSRETREPTASIVLRTRNTLGQNQVAAVQSLVAAAVPGLSPSNISIVDQNGTLLARSGEGMAMPGMASSLDDKRRRMEEQLRTRVESLLEETVGVGRVRTQVAVELELSSETTNEESYDPDSQVARSTRTIEENTLDQDRDPANVSVGNNLPDAGDADNAEATSLNRSDKVDETVNFEISRTVRTRVKESGDIKRLTVAVVVDGTYAENDDGTRVYQERSAAQIEQLATLVRSAIGYDANRGDVVEVVNLPFVQEEVQGTDAAEPFSLLGLDKDDLYNLLEMLLLGIVSLLVLLLVVRPLVNRLILAIPDASSANQAQLEGAQAHMALAGPQGYQITPELENAAAQGDPQAIEQLNMARSQGTLPPPANTEIDVAGVDNRLKDSSIKKVGEIVRSHPEEAAAIIRSWLYAKQ
ncbi:flagellar basal-body MS-ring/collar protein FliF [Iodidimonas gelatinilytica]|uniref:flagellar basal-body MS-ring/collar protein FliF n=1 Tax=Iodidimonas gelatinilytica TaxID=1236966 RepID=UPI001B2FFD85|nr:flagellar basal-body MS-ring/collar protein FliF [Iodidimonas gelatinilytica]